MTTIYTSTTVESSSTETSLLQGSVIGSKTLSSKFLKTGDIVKFKAHGTLSNIPESKLDLYFKIGSYSVKLENSFNEKRVNAPWSVDIMVVCNTENYSDEETTYTGNITCTGQFILGQSVYIGNFGPVEDLELDTNLTNTIDFTAQWDVLSPLNSIKCCSATIESTREVKDINIISTFASPGIGPFTTGVYYDNAFHGTASSTLAGAAGRLDLAPFFVFSNLIIDQIGVACSTAVAGALGKVVVYDSTSQGWPDKLLFQGSTGLDFATTGYKYHTCSFTFEKGKIYWVGIHQSSTATLRTINVSSSINLGINGSSGSNYFTILRRTVTYASGAPTTWNFVVGDKVANVTPPSVRTRSV